MLVKVKTLTDNGLYSAEDSVYLRYFWAMQWLLQWPFYKNSQHKLTKKAEL